MKETIDLLGLSEEPQKIKIPPELIELLHKIKENVLYNQGITLSRYDLRLLIRYINSLEKIVENL